MKRVVFSIILVAALASVVYAAVCRAGDLQWSYSIGSHPTFAVKGNIVNPGKATISSVMVKVDIFRKKDNVKVTTMSATKDDIAPGAKVPFIAGPARAIEPGTVVDNLYYFRMQSITER